MGLNCILSHVLPHVSQFLPLILHRNGFCARHGLLFYLLKGQASAEVSNINISGIRQQQSVSLHKHGAGGTDNVTTDPNSSTRIS